MRQRKVLISSHPEIVSNHTMVLIANFTDNSPFYKHKEEYTFLHIVSMMRLMLIIGFIALMTKHEIRFLLNSSNRHFLNKPFSIRDTVKVNTRNPILQGFRQMYLHLFAFYRIAIKEE